MGLKKPFAIICIFEILDSSNQKNHCVVVRSLIFTKYANLFAKETHLHLEFNTNGLLKSISFQLQDEDYEGLLPPFQKPSHPPQKTKKYRPV